MAEPPAKDAEPCPHASVEFLGEDKGRNRYLRCRSCGAVLVHDGRRVWVVPSEDVPSYF